MNLERWQQVSRVFKRALDRAPDARADYVARTCGDDASLRREVEELLRAHEQAEGASFISAPAVEDAAPLIAAEQDALAPAETISHYRVLRRIGTGGMGEVYLAEDTKPEHRHRKVALKLLHSQFTADREHLHRFKHEAEAALTLNHPNVMTIYEIGTAGDVRFIATEYIEGATLRQQLSERRLALPEALEIASQIAAALAAAHEAGIIHRDIKPENVMVRPDGYVKVLDFGLAKLTDQFQARHTDANDTTSHSLFQTNPGMVLGTISYMSPEQARGQPLDTRTDIWSLGVVLYELLTGRLPFEGADIYLQATAIMTREQPTLAHYLARVPAGLEEIVSRTLAKSPDARYQTAHDLLRDLRRLNRKLTTSGELEALLPAQMSRPVSSTPTLTIEAQPRARTTSGRSLVGAIKRHPRAAALWAATLSALAAIGFLLYESLS
jgi:serine/threonine protein kinase